ncbi:MAG: M23 family peptidase, partial [Xenophilus sp.]
MSFPPHHDRPLLPGRRRALLGAAVLLAGPTVRAAPPSAAEVWPHALQVPGGVARLSLGPAAG